MSSPAVCGSLTSASPSLSAGVSNSGGIGLQLTGTWTGTVSFEASIDGLTFVALNLVPSNSATAASSATSNGCWTGNVAGFAVVRARFSTATSGTVGVTLLNADAAGRF
jgi:hypothetical protein